MSTADKVFAALLVFIPICAYAALVHAPAPVVFAASAAAVLALAKYIGEATEELTPHVGVAAGGILNATFGNAPELIIAFIALQHGLVEVVKATIVGSVLGNLLFVLGIALIAGGIHHRQQKFNEVAAKVSGSSLLLVILALIMPATFVATSQLGSSAAVETLSLVVAALLVIAYAASLVFSLWTHQHLYEQQAAQYMPRWSVRRGVFTLFFATMAVAYVSHLLVDSIQPTLVSLGWTETFIGIVVLAIISNAAEHATAVRIAIKNKVDLALQITIGSATQIAMFVAPLLVIVSYFLPTQMNLVFSTFELVALVLSVLVVNSIVEDGESNWFEGLQLLVAYIVIATAFFLHP